MPQLRLIQRLGIFSFWDGSKRHTTANLCCPLKFRKGINQRLLKKRLSLYSSQIQVFMHFFTILRHMIKKLFSIELKKSYLILANWPPTVAFARPSDSKRMWFRQAFQNWLLRPHKHKKRYEESEDELTNKILSTN